MEPQTKSDAAYHTDTIADALATLITTGSSPDADHIVDGTVRGRTGNEALREWLLERVQTLAAAPKLLAAARAMRMLNHKSTRGDVDAACNLMDAAIQEASDDRQLGVNPSCCWPGCNRAGPEPHTARR